MVCPAPLVEETMPFKSESQRRKFEQLVKDGKMSQATLDKWQSETPKEKLPEKVSTTNKGQIRSVRKVK